MTFDGKRQVLVVSSSDKADSFIGNLLSGSEYCADFAKSGTDARQRLSDRDYEIVIINAPLNDEYGTELAENIIKDSYAGVMLLVKADVYDEVAFSMEKIGVFCIPKPISPQVFTLGLSLTASAVARLKGFAKKTDSLKEKMEEIKLVGRAKLLLITKLSFTEEDAHKYIEKQAMDRCVRRSVIALEIIKTYI